MVDTIHALTTLAGQKVSYKVVHSSRARRLRITVSGNGVTVVLPSGIQLRDAEQFMHQNAAWVIQQLERVKNSPREANPLPRDTFNFHGVPTRVQIIEEPGRIARVKVEQNPNRFTLYVPPGTPHQPLVLLEPWLREEARRVIGGMVHQQAHRMQVKPKSLSIRDQRTRWGSCSSRGTLSFNWRIIMAPPQVQEYVVIHELAHLKHPNHSSLFWAFVTRFLPEYKTSRQWLRKNAIALRTTVE